MGVDATKTLTLNIVSETGQMSYQVKRETQGKELSRFFDLFASSKGVETNSLRFTIDGERIKADQLEMEDGDQIDVMIEQQGGEDDGEDGHTVLGGKEWQTSRRTIID